MRTNRKRLFFPLATAMAVLALGLAYSRTAPTEYTAVAVVQLSVLPGAGNNQSHPPADDARLYEKLASPENLTAALAAVDRASGRSGSDAQAARRLKLAGALRTRWDVAVGRDGSDRHRQLSVIYTGGNSRAAARTVNAVARFIAGQHADALVEESLNSYNAARRTATAAKQRWSEANRALDEAIAVHLEEIQASKTEPNQTAPATTQPPTGGTALPSVDKTIGHPQSNPAWTNLSEQLSRAGGELERLLQKKTREHPQVIVAQWHIAQIQRLLAQTPRYVTTDAREDPSLLMPPERNRSGKGELESLVTQNRPDAAVKPTTATAETAAFVQLRHQQLEAASQKHAESAAAERTAWEQYVTAKATATGNVHPAMADDLAGHSAAALIVLGSCIASVVAAWGVALVTKPRNHVLHTVEDARKHLSVPVVGVLSTA